MSRTKAQLVTKERDSIQNDGRKEPPSSNVPSYELEFKLSFSPTNNNTFTATFDLSYDAFLDVYLIRKTLFETLTVCLKEQGLSFISDTSSVECVENKEQFQSTILSILEKGMENVVDKRSNESTLLECTNWSARDDTTFTCTILLFAKQ